jgi:hypothetical protein
MTFLPVCQIFSFHGNGMWLDIHEVIKTKKLKGGKHEQFSKTKQSFVFTMANV